MKAVKAKCKIRKKKTDKNPLIAISIVYFLQARFFTEEISPWRDTIASRDQFKPIRTGSDAVLHMSRIEFEFRPTQINFSLNFSRLLPLPRVGRPTRGKGRRRLKFRLKLIWVGLNSNSIRLMWSTASEPVLIGLNWSRDAMVSLHGEISSVKNRACRK